jgi:hypothetical protein
LREANANAAKLAEIAEEMANAKESTDIIVEDLTGAMEALFEGIHTREGKIITLNDQIETYEY